MVRLAAARLDDPMALELVEELQDWYVQLYGGRDEDPLDAAAFAPPAGGFLLGRRDGEQRPVAMGGWTRGDHPELGPAAVLRRMFVVPAERRQGLAGRLLAALEDDARRAGLTRMILATGSPQRDAVAFYRAVGYTDIPRYGFYAAHAGAVCLGKPL